MDDSRLYADIAKNWLQHGIYGITNSGVIMPTLSRLPGYPAFLAAVFAIFGIDNFRAVLLVQVLFDLATCFLVADMARRLFSERAAKAAFLFAALCPFLANYAAAALTETLEIFFTALAFDLVFRDWRWGALRAAPRGLARLRTVDWGQHPAEARRRNPAGRDRRVSSLAALSKAVAKESVPGERRDPTRNSFWPGYSSPSAPWRPWSHGRCAICIHCTAWNP